jgi:hypothetical protein
MAQLGRQLIGQKKPDGKFINPELFDRIHGQVE